MQNIVIGIEGLVGSGKTSICRELLNIIPNSIVIHGGNLYRGIIYALMNSNKKLSLDNLNKKMENVNIKDIMDELNISFKIEDRETVVYANGEKIDEEKLQSKETSMAVSLASKDADNKKLFLFFRETIEELKKTYNIILSGRAIMQIYPDVNYHFFIVADIDERVKRKASQYGNDVDLNELKKHIQTRDDLQEKAGFYKIYPNTIQIDVTDCKNALESTKQLCEYIEELKLKI
ncbi:MAG: (d)CMP kinase [Clostridia bacterium]|nr:(d)CMP kinase [Clostridia bacterium]